MNYYEYDQQSVESDPADFLSDIDENSRRLHSYAFLNLADGLTSLLGLNIEIHEIAEKLGEYSPSKMNRVLKKRSKVIDAFLQNDQLPETKDYQRWHWLSYRFRSLLQVTLLYVAGRFGNKNAEKRFLLMLKEGSRHQRFGALCVLSQLEFFNAEKLSQPWLTAFRVGVKNSTCFGTLWAELAEAYCLNNLEGELLSLADRVAANESIDLVEVVIKITSKSKLRDELAKRYLPKLDLSQAGLWFSRFARADEDSNGRFQPIVRSTLDRIIQLATPIELGEFLDHFRGRAFLKYAASSDVDALERVAALPNPSNEPNLAMKISKAKSLLSDLLPKRDIRLILDSGRFENVSEKILEGMHDAEINQIVAGAQHALDANETFGCNSIHLLWESCGYIGKHFLFKNLDSMDFFSIQSLAWFVDSMTLEKLAEAIVNSGLSERSPKSLAAAVKRKFGPNCGPDSFFHLMEVCKRHLAYDMESGEIPPDYSWLIKSLGKASAGYLRPSKIHCRSDDKTESWMITLTCFGKRVEYSVNNTGDWYEVGATEKAIEKALRAAGLKDKFHFIWNDGQIAVVVFGPTIAIRKIAKLAAIPLGIDHPDDLEEMRCQIISKIRKKVGRKFEVK